MLIPDVLLLSTGICRSVCVETCRWHRDVLWMLTWHPLVPGLVVRSRDSSTAPELPVLHHCALGRELAKQDDRQHRHEWEQELPEHRLALVPEKQDDDAHDRNREGSPDFHDRLQFEFPLSQKAKNRTYQKTPSLSTKNHPFSRVVFGVPGNVCKPNFVCSHRLMRGDGNLSRPTIARRLERATKFALTPKRVYHAPMSPWGER